MVRRCLLIQRYGMLRCGTRMRCSRRGEVECAAIPRRAKFGASTAPRTHSAAQVHSEASSARGSRDAPTSARVQPPRVIRVREHEPQTRPPEMSDTLRTEIDGGTGCSKVDFF